jgi:hypothetical protein
MSARIRCYRFHDALAHQADDQVHPPARPPDTRYLPMAQKRTLNERRLTKRQVKELISSGARQRPDLSSVFASTLL